MTFGLKFSIGQKEVGDSCSCFIIAEAGVNHNGDIERAFRLVDAASEAGADAIKFQTFVTENLVTRSAKQAKYQEQNTGKSESQFEMLKKLELSFADFEKIKQYCDDSGIQFLSTPFDLESLDFLDSLDVSAYKISSGDLTNTPFLKSVASKGKPMIVSTGMSMLSEVEEAVKAISEVENKALALLHCTSNYPTDPNDVNLNAMDTMKHAFHVPVGFSDHTLGIEIALGAVALGAVIIEKHLTLSKDLPGPDHAASLEPDELAQLVKSVRMVERALGSGVKAPSKAEQDTARVAKKSLTLIKPIEAGTQLTSDMIDLKRPGTGLPASFLSQLLGKKLKVNVEADTLLTLDMLE